MSIFIGSDTITYYYKSDINKAVWKNKDKEEFECEDYGIPTDSIITFKIYPTKEKIQGQEVEVLEYQSKYFWTRYYMSKALKISPKTYKDHLAYNMSFYGDKTEGGLILKLEHRFENYSMRGDLLELKRYKPNFIAIEINKNEIINTCNNN